MRCLMVFTAVFSLAISPDGFAQEDCKPLETRQANVPDQEPAFPEQHRACEDVSETDFNVEVIASGLEHPWAVEPLSNGDFLVTERPGRLRFVSADGKIGDPVEGIPEVFNEDQGGLLDVTLSPDFDSDRTIFFSFSEPRQDGNTTAVAKGTFNRRGSALENVEVIFRAEPAYAGEKHFGSRLLFDDEGHLFITLGERSEMEMRAHSQQLNTHLGTLVRINEDGSVPDDNPFVEREDAKPEVWSWGHRNVQAAAFDENGQLWVVEHGAKGGDELNRIEEGANYGWPFVAFGEQYSGEPLPMAKTQREGYEDPVYYWDPSLAPSGAIFYQGDAFPEWRGNLFTGSLADRNLVRLVLEDGKVAAEERLLEDRGERIRDVREGNDGLIYVLTDAEDGKLLRIAPKEQPAS